MTSTNKNKNDVEGEGLPCLEAGSRAMSDASPRRDAPAQGEGVPSRPASANVGRVTRASSSLDFAKMFGIPGGKGGAKVRPGGVGGGAAPRPTCAGASVEETSAKPVSPKPRWNPRSGASPRVSLARVELPGALLVDVGEGEAADGTGWETSSIVSVSSAGSLTPSERSRKRRRSRSAARPANKRVSVPPGSPVERPAERVARSVLAAERATEELRSYCRISDKYEIVEMIRKAAVAVEDISAISKNLKGTSVKGLREAARAIKTGTLELATRLEAADGPPGEGSCELAEARALAQTWRLRFERVTRERDALLEQQRELPSRVAKVTRRGEVTPPPPPGGRSPQRNTAAELEEMGLGPTSPVPGLLRGFRDGEPPSTPRRSEGTRGEGRQGEAPPLSLRDVEQLVNRVVGDRLHALESRIMAALRSGGGDGAPFGAASRPDDDPGEGPSGLQGGKTKAGPEVSRPKPARAEKGVEAEARPAEPVKSGSGKGDWTPVVSRRSKRAAKAAAAQPAPGPTGDSAPRKKKVPPEKGPSGVPPPAGEKSPRLPKQPRSAAVVMTVPLGCEATYASAMAKVTSSFSLEEVGVTEGLSFARARTGALMMRVRGEGGREKAAAIAGRMRTALEGTGVLVSTPTRKAEIRLRGLDVCSTPESIRDALAKAASCTGEEIRVGVIHRPPTSEGNGPGTCWARVPLAAARKLAGEGRVRVGWTSARVEVLEQRPLQCFRCLRRGHTWSQCDHTGEASRIDRCYRCGDVGHRSATCDAAVRCPLCSDLGLPAGHRSGTKACPSFQPGSKPGRKGGPAKAGKKTAPPPVDPPRPPEGGQMEEG